SEVIEPVLRFRYNHVGPLFGVNVALREAPGYRAAAQAPEVDRAFMTILGLETPEVVFEMYRSHPAGKITRPLTRWGAAPRVRDPSQAREGFHTAFMWEKVPYGLEGDAANWDRQKEAHAAEVLARWSEYAPNVRDEVIASRYALSPLDTERHFPN